MIHENAETPEEASLHKDRSRGNAMVMGVMVIVLMSMFGSVLITRMIIDSNTAARNIMSTKAFFMANGGIQWGRRYLVDNAPGATVTVGQKNIAQAIVTVTIEPTRIYYEGFNSGDREDVWIIRAVCTAGDATREIEEVRRRGAWGGQPTKSFVLWREVVADEF